MIFKFLKNGGVIMRQILKDMKKVYRDLYNADGQKRKERATGWIPRVIKEEHARFLDAFMVFILESDMLSDVTKRYISSYGLSVADMVEQWNNDEGNTKLELKPTINKINYDIKKLVKYFPDDKMLENVARRLPEVHEYKLSDYEEQLFQAASEFLKPDPMVKNLVIKVPKTHSKTNLSNEKWNELLVILAPYTKDFIRQLEGNLDSDMVAYFNFLIRSPLTKNKDIERFSQLQKLLTDSSEKKIGRPPKDTKNFHKKDYSTFEILEDDLELEFD